MDIEDGFYYVKDYFQGQVVCILTAITANK